MKRLLAALAACLLLSFSACGMEAKDIYRALDGLAENLGDSQITRDSNLIGTRTLNEDSYTGNYTIECDCVTGRDVIFGGASVESRELYLHGTMHTDSGKATVRIRLNQEITELPVSEDGSFQMMLNLNSGGNYIMVDYQNFTGNINFVSEYKPILSTKEELPCTENYVGAETILRFAV